MAGSYVTSYARLSQHALGQDEVSELCTFFLSIDSGNGKAKTLNFTLKNKPSVRNRTSLTEGAEKPPLIFIYILPL